jgi:hypothetical protein
MYNNQKGANMQNLTQMDDVAILNALFDIAAIEADEYGELTWQDEQDYQQLDRELSCRRDHGRSH